MLSIEERLAFRLASLGAALLSAGVRLRQGGPINDAAIRLDEARDALGLLREAVGALEAGDENRCRRILDSLAQSGGNPSAPAMLRREFADSG
jgi:hypothetical protein